jgi:hypothetical protein
MESSFCEKPERHAPRRLSDDLKLEGQKQKVHSLVDKVYSRKNLKLAWERVRANHGASGSDKVTIEEFEAGLEKNLERQRIETASEPFQSVVQEARDLGRSDQYKGKRFGVGYGRRTAAVRKPRRVAFRSRWESSFFKLK